VQPLTIALVAFVLLFSAGLLGLRMQPHERHAADGSRDGIRLVQTLLTGMTAAAIGMLLATSSGRFRDQESTVAALASKVAVLDLLLREYGPETGEIRLQLQRKTEAARDDIRGAARLRIADDLPLLEMVLPLTPRDDRQRIVQAQILRYAMDISEGRATLMTRENTYGIQPAMIALLIGWLMILFFATGLYAPINAMMVTAMLCGALSLSSALLLVLEQDRPFHGLLPVTAVPLEEALRVMRSR